MAIWKKFENKQQEPHEQNTKTDNGDKILEVINSAFGLPDNIRDEVIATIDNIIKNSMKNGVLYYDKTVELACEGYTEEQVIEAFGQQLLGAYVAYTLITGKPLRLK